ncbi:MULTISPECIES: YncE family protein [unclassified Streptomyces]|jgi:YVTN family beta-propeller protein|uniref:YncE family protein n=1 Tax=unclassified Streptomyces TaxID=2593676 RepID=UPI00081B3B8D|nr:MULTISPECIES: YncE family protein [unclassified Streptomyces]MYQ86215.1 beta-propeller fold lactonase family protein [Streptomyces sp. SID4936]SCE18610.1 40-residue YVTN family beta-propeller repeat-containing protein [Streptomyces sp. DvalAA-43]
MPPTTKHTAALLGGVLLAVLTGCGTSAEKTNVQAVGSEAARPAEPDRVAPPAPPGLPGMPPVLDAKDVYAADRVGKLSPVVKDFPSRVYVPNTNSDTVSVIDPATYKVIKTIKVGRQPQHVVPSWDLKTLWVNNDIGDSLTALDPATGKTGRTVPVSDPYNLYFTPDGKYAVVMASMDRQLVFRDAHTMKTAKTVPVDCAGVNHADFSTDGRYFIVSCEFSGELLKVDTARMKVVAQQKLPLKGAMPQDVKLSPDGGTFYIADMIADGMWVLDGKKFTTPKLLRTGKGAHGLYVSRDSKEMYVSNRGEGSISVFDFAQRKLVKKWRLPGGGSPDMGGVSADGKVLWLSGRYNSEVYAIDTATGKQLARIPVGSGPHGLAVYPQPGRYSLGHTGVFR